MLDSQQTTSEQIENHKHIIYQLFVRYFGNKNTRPKYYGSLQENGSGKFNDITSKALLEIQKLGITHVWYTGIVEHATMTDYTDYGINLDDPDVVKGIAGSPYAIKDYYDVHPDLAEEVPNRMKEFEALVQRTHEVGLKVLIDFVPNHLARTYHSDASPRNIIDFGAADNKDVFFSETNDFYYIPDHKFTVPYSYNPGGNDFQHPLKDGKFDEFPAKATGNDVFKADPSIDDWFETIKLNYGIDFSNNGAKHFVPRPPVWEKMRDILIFWARKGVDGFRCDMVEHVPVEFWNWVIGDLKKKFPHLVFIGEAYERSLYKSFIHNGKFDYLYDKVGLYDGLKKLIKDDVHATVSDITNVWKYESNGVSQHMLRFLENHDETRIASSAFAGNPWYAIPGMVVSATLSSGPVMIYNGQEVGEPARDSQGFSGNDGRSTIFDYWNLPQLQKWMNNGDFDGALLDGVECRLRDFYSKLLNISKSNIAIAEGKFYELMQYNWDKGGLNQRTYVFVRYKNEKKVLVVANFGRADANLKIALPDDLIEEIGLVNNEVQFIDLLSDTVFTANNIKEGLEIQLPPTSAVILDF